MNVALKLSSFVIGSFLILTSQSADSFWQKTDATTYDWATENAWQDNAGGVVDPPSGSDAAVFLTKSVNGTRMDAANQNVPSGYQTVKTPLAQYFTLGSVAGTFTHEIQVRKTGAAETKPWKVTFDDAVDFHGIWTSAGLDWTLAFSGAVADPEIGAAEPRLRTTVEVPSGTTARLGALVGAGGSLTKSGAGTLKVGGALNASGVRMTVAGGTLELGAPAAPAGNPVLWLDASRTNRMDLVPGENGRLMVNAWRDVRPDCEIVARAKSGIPAPFLGTEKLNGVAVVDFGRFNDGSVTFSGADAGGLVYDLGQDVKDIIVVYADTDSPAEQNMRAFVVGQEGSIYHFHRGQFGRIGYSATHANVHLGALYLDGVKTTCDSVPGFGRFHALEYELAGDGLRPATFAIDRNVRKGGVRIAEAIFYAERLTPAERAQTMRYLARKWNDPGFLEGFDAAVLETASDDVKVSVPAGCAAAVHQAVVGGTKLVKTGAGALRVGRFQPESPTIEVAGGTVGLDPLAANVSDLEPAADPFFWGDARRDDFTVDGGAITEWKDRRGAGVTTKGVVQQGAPTLVDNACRGQRVLDFGESGVNPAIIKVGTAEYKICEAFQVVRIVRQNNNGSGYYPSVFGDKNYNLVRYKASSLVHPTLATGSPSAGIWTMNGRTVDPWDVFAIDTDEYYVASFSSASGTSANWLGTDRGSTTQCGDIQLGEVILYDRVLSDAERRQTIAYLMREWKGETYAFARDPAKIGTIAFTSDNADPRLDAEADTTVGSVSGAARVAKAGSARLTVEAPCEAALDAVTVEGGTLELAKGFAPTFPKAAFHVDASRADSFVFSDDGRIERWNDVDGNGRYARRPAYAKGQADCNSRGGLERPALRVSDGSLGLLSGMPYVDFLDWQAPDGDCEGSSGMLFFDAAGIWKPTDVREIHMVYMMCDGSNATPIGGDPYPDASHPERMVPRGNSSECYWKTCCAAASPKMADGSAWYTANTFLADGTTAATSFHVLSVAATGDLAPQTFAMDRNCAIGGVKLCEVLFYTGATNDTATATAINRALLKKWTGLGSGADFGKRLSVALANGGTFKLGAGASMVAIMSVSGNGTLDAGDIAGVGTLSATVAADGTVEPVTVKGAVAFADEVTLNVNVASERKPAAGEYVVFAADALTNVDLSKWTFNVTGNWLDDRVYGFRVADGKVYLTVQKKGLVIILK